MTQQERLHYLFARCMGGTATPEEQEELQGLFQLPEQEAQTRSLIYEALQAGPPHHYLSETADEAILSAIFNAPAIKETAVVHRMNSGKNRTWKYAVAAAIIIGLLAGGVYLLSGSQARKDFGRKMAVTSKVSPVKQDIAPGTDQAVLTLANGRQIVLNKTGNGQLAKEGNATVINLNGLLTYQPAGTAVQQMSYNTISVPRKGQYQLILSDGTKVWLNAESSLRFPVAFTGNDRTVELTGEGYFEIAKDPSKPFHVKTEGTDVMALGTHFNVMAYPNEAALQTTLLEGSVKISYADGSGMLKPGQQSSLSRSNNNFSTRYADVEEVMAWKNGIFLFNDKTPLPSVMRQLERWYDIEVTYEGAVPAQNFGGGLQRSLPLSGVLSVLEQSGIRFRANGQHITVLQ